MENTYNWVVSVEPYLKKSVEKKLDKDLEELGHFIPCHAGPLLVSIVSTDAVTHTITGSIRCQCRKEVATFNAASNGSDLDYQLCEVTTSDTLL